MTPQTVTSFSCAFHFCPTLIWLSLISHFFQPSMPQVSVPLYTYTFFDWACHKWACHCWPTLSLTEHATSERATVDLHFFDWACHKWACHCWPTLSLTEHDTINSLPSILMTARVIKNMHLAHLLDATCHYWPTLMIYRDVHSWGSIFSILGCAEHSLELSRNNLTVYCANFFNYINWWVH